MTTRHRSGGDSNRRRAGRRAAIFLALAGALVLALASLLAACGSDTSQAPSEKVQAMLQERWEGMNAGDTKAVAKAFATNAVLDNYADGGANVQGSAAIAAYFRDAMEGYGMQWIADGDPIRYDKYVVQPIKMTGKGPNPGTGATLHIMEIDANDQITHEWIVGWVEAPPS